MVGDELEDAALCEDCGFIIDRAIFEAEEQTGDDPVAAHHLEEVTHGKHMALFRTQHEKTVDGPLHMTHGYGLCWCAGLQGTDEHRDA
jgi:hypothetical protein